jgi:hypothetical protein
MSWNLHIFATMDRRQWSIPSPAYMLIFLITTEQDGLKPSSAPVENSLELFIEIFCSVIFNWLNKVTW